MCLRICVSARLCACESAHLRACESSRLYHDLPDPRSCVKSVCSAWCSRLCRGFRSRGTRHVSHGRSARAVHTCFTTRPSHTLTPPHTQNSLSLAPATTKNMQLLPPHTRSTSCCVRRHFHVSLLRQHVTGANDTLVARVASFFVTSTKHSDHMLLLRLRITRANNRPPIRGRKR